MITITLELDDTRTEGIFPDGAKIQLVIEDNKIVESTLTGKHGSWERISKETAFEIIKRELSRIENEFTDEN